MNFFIGFVIALAVFVPMFIKVWKSESPVNPEDAKTLIGSLD